MKEWKKAQVVREYWINNIDSLLESKKQKIEEASNQIVCMSPNN